MGKIVAISNQKGGVGKTTTAINLSSGLSYMQKKVLLVDLDSQGNASTGLSAIKEQGQPTIYSVLFDGVNIQQAIVHLQAPSIDILPANLTLAGADLLMNEIPNKELILKNVLDPIKHLYDYIIIDCPPSLGLLNTNALSAADSVLIPVQCEYYALEGVTQLLMTIRLVQKTSNPNLKIEGLVMTMYDVRTKLSMEVCQDVRQTFEKLVYQTNISRNIKLSEAPSRGVSIFEYDINSSGAKSYGDLTKEFVKRNEGSYGE
ncbi:ParA family protein [Floccifex sp.]|uniref:ParA family protein n=1 Tax=Floccifex sp. TaxID=2815810 RepID=UPI003F02D587